MAFTIEAKHLNGVIILCPQVFEDGRGFFMEVYREDQFKELGIPSRFLQDNHSRSAKNVLRGLHFQWNPPQGKLVRVTYGRAFFAIVDIRKESPTTGKWISIELSAENKKFIYVPPGFANGFCSLSDFVEVQYKCTNIYNKECEGSILWNDPAIGIRWPIQNPIISKRDANGITLEQWFFSSNAHFFKYPVTG
jgi:dTDP-4-dehydrorhamnose 3,5-epimerase